MAPAYDMSPMGFAPRSGGGLPDTLAAAGIPADVANEAWRRAETLARLSAAGQDDDRLLAPLRALPTPHFPGVAELPWGRQ